MSEKQATRRRGYLNREMAKLGFEHAKSLAGLSAISMVLIGSFLRVGLPLASDGRLYVSLGSQVLIAGSFVLLGLSLLLSALAMHTFFRAMEEDNPHRIKARYQTRTGIPFLCLFLGLVWFGVAVLVSNL